MNNEPVFLNSNVKVCLIVLAGKLLHWNQSIRMI